MEILKYDIQQRYVLNKFLRSAFQRKKCIFLVADSVLLKLAALLLALINMSSHYEFE